MNQPLPPIIDSHAHLYFPQFEGQVPALLTRAAEAGVEAIVNIGTQPTINPQALAQTRQLNAESAAARAALAAGGADVNSAARWPQLYATVGFHPHEARLVQPADWPEIERLAADPLVVGLGEFGLDYHYEHSPRDVQREVFRGGIRLALRTGKAMVIHSREAGLEAIGILDEEAAGQMPRGVFHCFTDSWDLAAAALERGFSIGLTGIITFPKSENVREMARRIPLDRLLVETDAPFCAPVPMRGQTNEPAFVAYVCEKLAELHGRPVAEIRRHTTANARRLYGLDS